MPTKFLPLCFVGALSLCASLSFADNPPDCVEAKTCVPLTIDNQSGEDLYVFIQASASGQYFDFQASSYSKPFNNQLHLQAVKNKNTALVYLPGDALIGGGRMYFSTGRIKSHSELESYIYDKIELGWSKSGTAIWNTTSVDFFGMPLQIIRGSNKIGFKDGSTREKIIEALRTAMLKEPDLYNAQFGLYKPEPLRIFSPQHFYTSLNNDWAESINADLDSLDSNDAEKGTGDYFNYTYGGKTFTHIKKLSPDSLSVTDAQGHTTIISGIKTGNAVAGEIKPVGNMFAGMVSAALNRGVLGKPKLWGSATAKEQGEPNNYYQGEISPTHKYNTYAKVLTENAINSRIYAISYDDFWHMESSMNVGPANNAPVTVKILPFK